jgi:hypothetical protein
MIVTERGAYWVGLENLLESFFQSPVTELDVMEFYG